MLRLFSQKEKLYFKSHCLKICSGTCKDIFFFSNLSYTAIKLSLKKKNKKKKTNKQQKTLVSNINRLSTIWESDLSDRIKCHSMAAPWTQTKCFKKKNRWKLHKGVMCNVVQPAKTHIHQLGANNRCCLEDLPRAMADRDR